MFHRAPSARLGPQLIASSPFLQCASLEPEGTVAFHHSTSFGCQAGGGAGLLPTSAWEECLLPVLHAPAAWVCMQPACHGGLGAKGNLIVFPAHMFYSL